MHNVQDIKVSKKHGSNQEKEETGTRDRGKINEVLKTRACCKMHKGHTRVTDKAQIPYP